MTEKLTLDTGTETQEIEVKNPAALIAKNKELLTKLKQSQDDIASAQVALQAAQTESASWRKQWHDLSVIAPLDAALEDACVGPTKYLRAELLEREILKLEPDAQGTERPAWYLNGERATPVDLHKFLCDIADPVLSKMIRAKNTSGSGAGSSSGFAPKTPTAPAPVAPPSFGLR
ncbi:hypothetical protein [Rhodoferax antarcticus]|uniref:Uncharacterized protein n=1 Tax=Rhodoferax antarcticus ANT.BR TaxID=1111071 RepID=A0A1Q8YAU8_9BURK|nr:hypothetical protein [Rhodoferax antarcticus]APW47065.1 hypothetical protein RA876_12645 [Rhodoferax antarcticus]OLP04940.1 hypothetical protein BLL52_3760 [Rhodoferax antarcticus ANT.BR]